MKQSVWMGFGLAAIVALASTTASAGVAKGMNEWNAMGMISQQSAEVDVRGGGDVDTTLILLQATYNRFLQDNISAGVSLMRMSTEVKLDMGRDNTTTEATFTFILGRGDYYFVLPNSPTWLPYAGVRAGVIAYEFLDESSTTITYGIHGGFKKFVSENTSLNVEIVRSAYKLEVQSVNVDVTEVQALVGVSLYL